MGHVPPKPRMSPTFGSVIRVGLITLVLGDRASLLSAAGCAVVDGIHGVTARSDLNPGVDDMVVTVIEDGDRSGASVFPLARFEPTSQNGYESAPFVQAHNVPAVPAAIVCPRATTTTSVEVLSNALGQRPYQPPADTQSRSHAQWIQKTAGGKMGPVMINTTKKMRKNIRQKGVSLGAGSSEAQFRRFRRSHGYSNNRNTESRAEP